MVVHISSQRVAREILRHFDTAVHKVPYFTKPLQRTPLHSLYHKVIPFVGNQQLYVERG